jgi:hypothetical protein
VDKDRRFGTEEVLHAQVRALTAEVAKLRHELETTLRSVKKPSIRDFAEDRPVAQKRRQRRSK